MSTRKTLNCYVLGDEPDKISCVTAETVGVIKIAIKELNPKRFRHLDILDLDLWRVSIPLDGNFSKMSEVPEGSQELDQSWVTIETLFPEVQNNHLHILIRPPPPPPRLLNLKCFIAGDHPENRFLIEIEDLERVEALRDAIQAKIRDQFKITRPALTLWAVAIRIDQHLAENVAKFNFDDNEPLLLKSRLSQVFLAPLVNDCIQVLVRIQSTNTTHLESVLTARSKLYTRFDKEAPSTLAKATESRAFQDTDKHYACCRPGDLEPDLALTLLDPVFATFFEESQVAVLTRGDYNAARSLRDAMCKFYDDEKHRASALHWELLKYGIEIVPRQIGNSGCWTDGHKECNNRPALILEVKNEFGVGSADPSVQAIAHFELFCTEYQLWTEVQSYHPCFIMFLCGKC